MNTIKEMIIYFQCLFGKHDLEWFDKDYGLSNCKHCHAIFEHEEDDL